MNPKQCEVARPIDKLERLFEDVEAGETIHVTKYGQVVAVLVPIDVYERLLAQNEDVAGSMP